MNFEKIVSMMTLSGTPLHISVRIFLEYDGFSAYKKYKKEIKKEGRNKSKEEMERARRSNSNKYCRYLNILHVIKEILKEEEDFNENDFCVYESKIFEDKVKWKGKVEKMSLYALDKVKEKVGETNQLTYSKFSSLVTKILKECNILKRKKMSDDDFSKLFKYGDVKENNEKEE